MGCMWDICELLLRYYPIHKDEEYWYTMGGKGRYQKQKIYKKKKDN